MRRWLHLAFVAAALALPAAAQYPAADALTENSASQWGAAVAPGTGSAAVYNDTTRVHNGTASVRFETDAGFDTWMWTPVARNANWNLSGAGRLRFWAYAENPSPYGFQNQTPWIRLGTGSSPSNNYYQYQTDSDILDTAIGNWAQFSIPLTGDSQWHRTQLGSPNLADIDWLEIHMDTWDYGFKVWYDGMEFIPLEGALPAPTGVQITPFYSTAYLTWNPVTDPSVAGYEVYRRTASGSYGAPLKRVLRTSFTDYDLVPGQTYYYKLLAIDGTGAGVSHFTTEQAVTLGADPSLYSTHKNFELLLVFYKGGYTQTQIDQMVKGLKLGLEFYWRTSACRLNMDVTWLFIDGNPPGPDWGSGALLADLRNRGVQDHQYDLAFLVGNNLSGCLGGYVVFGSTCASLGTVCGVAYPGKDPNTNYTIAWTFTHEIHHALEVMQNLSPGTPEVLFDHFPWCYPNPLGPTGWHMDWGAHYDGIGLTNRQYGDAWMSYPAPYDGYIECLDADHDGLPESDTRVWMDEARFGSSPALADTDGDGLSDLEEYSAGNFRGTNPLNPDTDGDGLPDDVDPRPLYPAPTYILRMTTPPVIDGTIESAWPKLQSGYYFTQNTTDFTLTTYAGWDDDALYLAFASSRKLRFMVSVDGSGPDGRFESPVRYVTGTTDTYNDNTKGQQIGDSWGDGSHLYFAQGLAGVRVAGGSSIAGSAVASTLVSNVYYTEAKIPRQLPAGAAYTWYPPDAPVVDGLTLTAGHVIGLNVTLSNYTGSDSSEFSGTWTNLFETHSYVDFTLAVLHPGDLNCDGAVDFDDINPFVTALLGRASYEAAYPECPWLNGDIDRDGGVDFDDINPFVNCLVLGACP